jgi:DNA-binding NarL/FixJ family response regulator
VTKESIRVLVVEDHHVVRQGLVALLNVAEGLEVVAGRGRRGGITQFRKHLPDITLMDLRLPRMGGVDVIQRLRMETPGRASLCSPPTTATRTSIALCRPARAPICSRA